MKQKAQLSKENKKPMARQAEVSKNSRLILIVDNSPYTARATSQLFKSMGYSTEVEHSPTGALSMLNNGEVFPDLVFMEIRYQHETIFEFPKKVHANPLWSQLPIVARSATTDKISILRAVQSGYCDFILRPTEQDILKEKIEKIFVSSTKVDSTTFALPVFSRGSLAADIEISAISEFGVEGSSPVPLKENTILKIDSDFLKQFELSGTHFRVTGCEEKKERGKVTTKLP